MLLEKVVSETVTPEMSVQDTALALLLRCRDNKQHGLPNLHWYGGSEEELLKRGAIMCNEISRVFVCLCQIAGLRARLMCSHITGHMMTEVEVDGHWWWMDPRHGLCCLRDDGAPASTWDLWQDPSLFDRQPPERLAEVHSVGPFYEGDTQYVREVNLAFRLAMSRDCCFHPKEAVALGNYFVWERDRYSFPWFDRPADPDRLLRAAACRDADSQGAGLAGVVRKSVSVHDLSISRRAKADGITPSACGYRMGIVTG